MRLFISTMKLYQYLRHHAKHLIAVAAMEYNHLIYIDFKFIIFDKI